MVQRNDLKMPGPWCEVCESPARIFDLGGWEVHLCDATPAELNKLASVVEELLRDMTVGKAQQRPSQPF